MSDHPASAVARLNLLVLRAATIERTAAFYEALGFEFAPERHGEGPPHLASAAGDLSPLVLEIYPATCAVDTQAIRLGFEVADVGAAIERLLDAGGSLIGKPRPSPRGVRAVVADPDGRRVELTEVR